MNATTAPAYQTGIPAGHPHHGVPMLLPHDGSVPSYIHETYMDGYAEETGDVDSPMGHWYLVDEYLVQTDSVGNVFGFRYATWMEATVAFASVEAQYSDWLDQ